MKNVIILGGVGNGSVVAAAMEDANLRGNGQWKVAGFLNDRAEVGDVISGYPVLGGLERIGDYISDDFYFINTIYRIDGQEKRIDLFESHAIPDSSLATFIHPTAYVAPEVEIAAGCVVMPNVSVSPGARLGRCCLVMVGATLGHDTWIGSHCHFAAQSCVGAYIRIADGVHIGLNATVRENVTIGKHSTLAMGGVLINSIGDYEIWGGVPAKFLRKVSQEGGGDLG